MNMESRVRPFWLGLSIFFGLLALGLSLGWAAIEVRQFERTVTAKGLAEREYPADLVIWPVSFSAASNDRAALYADLEQQRSRVMDFLTSASLSETEISLSTPRITDRSAQSWGGAGEVVFRYVGVQTVTVRSRQLGLVRDLMSNLLELGKRGVKLGADSYEAPAEFLFTRLNSVKPSMVQEATMNARAVAQEFARDSGSRLGKIRRASQGQFSIESRDSHSPYRKNVRVVSTVEYYLSD